MPRVKGSPTKCVKPSNTAQPANTWVFLVKGEGLEASGGRTPDIVKMRHPATGEPAMFLLGGGDETLQEVLTFSEDKRSWFIGETVRSDGRLHLSTPIDPLFLVLPYLLKAKSAQPLDLLLQDDEFPETMRLIKSSGLLRLNQIADQKGDEELNAYRYNEEKALSWLQRRAERVAESLKQKGIHVTGGSISANFVRSSTDNSADNESYLRYAAGLVSEYLPEELSSKLNQKLGLPEEETPSNKRKSSIISSESRDSKKAKIETELSPTEEKPPPDAMDLSKSDKPEKISAKEKARAKAAQGSKSIASFFKKK